VQFVFTTLGYHPDLAGGAFRYVRELAEGLARRSHRVDVVYPGVDENEPRETTELRNSVHLHRFRIARGTFWRNWRDRNGAALKCLNLLRRDHPQSLIVSCHAYFARAVTRCGGPTVSLFTGPWSEEFLQSDVLKSKPFARQKLIAPTLRRIEQAGLARSSFILTISEYYRRQLPLWHPGLNRAIHVIEAGVNTEEFQPATERAKIRASLGIGADGFLFLAVRRLERRMGLIDLIDAFKPIAREFPGAHLFIGGKGPQAKILEERIRMHGLADRARLLGFISERDLPGRYTAADCTVMPSTDLEGFGLSTVESLACGTPVVGMRHGATPEILEPLSPDLLVDGAAELSGKFRAILANPSALPTRQQCREYVLERYNWERVATAVERLCLGLPEGAP